MFYLESFTFSALTLYVSVKSCLFIVGAESKLTERKTMKVSQKQMLSSLASWVPEILTGYFSTTHDDTESDFDVARHDSA